ncbi:poly(hydroxyalkanoate) granule-associated protein [Janthinobacterium sp. CG_23.3]|uniref:phasin family protein n=1 Tax=Janthinobacterium sp. CG_23.3 TaxID=3349634 RepID=UPI0038D51593
MVKKLKTLAKDEEKQLASAVRTSAQQIWQAGLGAFAKAQEEGGRVFSKLVKEGTELQKRAEDRVSDVTGTVTKMADGVSKQASGSWDKLEQVFEDRVSRALGKIGVPTQKDMQELSKRIEQLSKAVAELSGKKAPAVKAEAKAPVKASAKPAAKAAAKPAAKASSKPAAKAAAKPAAKAAPKAAAKPAVKVAPKAGGVQFPTAASIAKPAPKAAARKIDVKAAPAAPALNDSAVATPSA